MQDFAKLAAQIRAARGLLGWSQAYLPKVSTFALQPLRILKPAGPCPMNPFWFAAVDELMAAGVVFTEAGVEFRKWPPSPYVPGGLAMAKKRARRKYYSRGRGTCAPTSIDG